MPPLAHLDRNNALNAVLNSLAGSRGVLPDPAYGLQMNLARLIDKAIREYESARESFDAYVDAPAEQFRLGALVQAFDHLETCLDAVHRAGQHADELAGLHGPPKITKAQLPSASARRRIADARNAMQHAASRLLSGQTGAGTGRPIALMATSTSLRVGQRGVFIRYDWLASWITQYHDLVRDLISREPQVPR
jgi:hypothetical protein